MVNDKACVFNRHISLSFQHPDCSYVMELADESNIFQLKKVMSKTKQTVNLYLSVLGAELEEQPVVN